MATIDYYDLIETAVVDLIKGQLTTYFPVATQDKQVTKSDDTHLDSGHDYFAIAYPGVFPTEPLAGQTLISVTWEVILDMLVRFNASEPEAWTAFRTLRGELFNLFNVRRIGRTLNSTPRITSVLLSAEERPRYVPVEAGNIDSGIAFIAQALTLNIETKVNKVD